MRKKESSLLNIRQTVGLTEARVTELHTLVEERKRELNTMRLSNISSLTVRDMDGTVDFDDFASARKPTTTVHNFSERRENFVSDSDSDCSSNGDVSNLEQARHLARATVGKLSSTTRSLQTY
jgi:hypothetical protein